MVQASMTADMMIVNPTLMKVLTGAQRTLQAKYAHLGIPKHVTECKKQELAHACVRIRKRRDKSSRL